MRAACAVCSSTPHAPAPSPADSHAAADCVHDACVWFHIVRVWAGVVLRAPAGASWSGACVCQQPGMPARTQVVSRRAWRAWRQRGAVEWLSFCCGRAWLHTSAWHWHQQACCAVVVLSNRGVAWLVVRRFPPEGARAPAASRCAGRMRARRLIVREASQRGGLADSCDLGGLDCRGCAGASTPCVAAVPAVLHADMALTTCVGCGACVWPGLPQHARRTRRASSRPCFSLWHDRRLLVVGCASLAEPCASGAAGRRRGRRVCGAQCSVTRQPGFVRSTVHFA
jgi:hypothetical protein